MDHRHIESGVDPQQLPGLVFVQANDDRHPCRRWNQVLTNVVGLAGKLGLGQILHDDGHEFSPDRRRNRGAEYPAVCLTVGNDVHQRQLLRLIPDPYCCRVLGGESHVPGIEVTLVSSGFASDPGGTILKTAVGKLAEGTGGGSVPRHLNQCSTGSCKDGRIGYLGDIRLVLVNDVAFMVDDPGDDVVVGVQAVGGEIGKSRSHLQGRNGRRAEDDGEDRVERRFGDTHPAGHVDDVLRPRGL